ncbi:MAG: cobalamin-binding protein [Caldiserica bacterium]|nr:cobalamin-binding protein [Caldisericota bacterium]
MKKTRLLVLAAVMLFVGCGQTDTKQASDLTITDDLGHQIKVGYNPQRIISLTPNTTEIISFLGLGDKLIGRTNYCNYPPEVSKVPSIGDVTTFSIEKIVAMKPDLVVANRMISLEFIEKLQSMGVNVAAFDPNTVDGIIDTIKRIALICGVPDNTESLSADLQTFKKPENGKIVYVEIWNKPPTTFGKDTFGSDVVKWIGGINLGDTLEGAYPTTTDEALIKINPDIVILPTKSKIAVEEFKARKGFDILKAVKDNRVFAIDEDIISRPGPRIIDAIRQLDTDINH